jgi:ATP-dependent protease Clp ATPase subunit
VKQDFKVDRPIIHCTFCGKSEHDVHRMIASSPSIAACNNCIQVLSELLKENSDLSKVGPYEILRNEDAAQPDGSFWLFRRIRDSFNPSSIRCAFCHKRQVDVDRMIGKAPNYVCEQCIFAMVNLLEQEKEI